VGIIVFWALGNAHDGILGTSIITTSKEVLETPEDLDSLRVVGSDLVHVLVQDAVALSLVGRLAVASAALSDNIEV
jgi:hypothetical protein